MCLLLSPSPSPPRSPATKLIMMLILARGPLCLQVAATSALEPPEGTVVLSRQQFEYRSARGTDECEATMISFRAQDDDASPVTVWVVPSDDADPPSPLHLHWSLGVDKPTDWTAPPDGCMTPGAAREKSAVQTPLTEGEGGRLQATIPLSGVSAKAINAVIRDKGNDRWYKSGQADFHIPLTADPAAATATFQVAADQTPQGRRPDDVKLMGTPTTAVIGTLNTAGACMDGRGGSNGVLVRRGTPIRPTSGYTTCTSLRAGGRCLCARDTQRPGIC